MADDKRGGDDDKKKKQRVDGTNSERSLVEEEVANGSSSPAVPSASSMRITAEVVVLGDDHCAMKGTPRSSEHMVRAIPTEVLICVDDNPTDDESGAGLSPESHPGPSTAHPDSKKHSKSNSSRCQVCHKKVGLTGFGCRCGGLFCSEHRYSDKHSCPFDYHQLGAEEIRKNNPVVVSEKIKKI